MTRQTFFPIDSRTPQAATEEAGVARVQRPVRNQLEWVSTELDGLLPEEHQARTVWSYVERVDLSAAYAAIRAVEGGVGRSPIAPEILLALWLYATLDGIGSARALAKLCEEHVAYRWICGGVSVNYHTLADFRSQAGELLDRLLTESVTRLRAAGLVSLNRIAHDGLRVRASAGKNSFKRKDKLEQFRREAEEQVQALRRELEEDPSACDRRRKAARERAARERHARIEAALKAYPEVKEQKKHAKEQARVSTTDCDARSMRMPDGGFRPAYNVQLSTDTQSQVIVGVDVIRSGSDGGQLRPAVAQLQQRHGLTPPEMLVDGGYAKREDIEQLARAAPPCTVYAPPPELKTHDGRNISPPADESAEVKEWRARMQTEAAQRIYRERASTAECVNAQAHNRGLQQVVVRGVKKVLSVALLFALAHNLVRTAALLGGLG